ncbi:MAG TPA: antibiotic biosynthesis monooxygenase [Candidatus Paceibacterota bacterium]
MHCLIYHWKLKPGIAEVDFIKNWSEGTRLTYETWGSLGSSLHKATDGTFWAYARWPSKETRQRMFAERKDWPHPNEPFADHIGDPLELELLDDLLAPAPFNRTNKSEG